jgi:multiple sugar transport system substrate-binding protein
MKRRSLTVLLAVIMVFTLFLTACGGKDSDNNGAAKDTGSDKGQDQGAKKQEKVVVDFWSNKFEDTTEAWWKRWVDEFNKSQDRIEVKFQVVPGDAWAQKMKAAQAAGSAPQIYTMNYGNIAPAVLQGQILAMDEYTDPKIWEDLYDNIEGFVTVKGKHYAYPKLVEPSAVLYYRKDFFKEVGLDPEKAPTTWDELIEYGKKLSKDGRYGLHIANNAVEYSWTTWGQQMNGGQRIISEDWTKATLSEHHKNLIAFYKRIYDEKVAPAQALNGYTSMDDFGQGKVAMAVNGSWGIGQLRNDYADILPNVGVAPMVSPDGDHTKPTASLGGWTLVIDGKAKNPKEAAEFISWILAGNPEIMIDYFKTSKFSKFPTRKSVDEALNKNPDAKDDAVRKLIAEKIVPYSVSEPTYPWDVSFKFGEAVERAVKGEDVQKSFEKLEKDINEYIKLQDLPSKNPNK